MSDTDWMILLSGPLAQRGPLLAALDREGVDVEQAHNPRGLPDTTDGSADPTVGWIAARHPSVDEVVDTASRAGWALRMHYPTPRCGACEGLTTIAGTPCLHCSGTGRTDKPTPTPEQVLRDELATMHRRLAALEAKGT